MTILSNGRTSKNRERRLPFAGIEPVRAPATQPVSHGLFIDPVEDLFLVADPRTRDIKALARRIAATRAPVLILGESGVGKGELARFIHGASPRAGRPFVKVHCSSTPHDLLESELFGYETGSSTGAPQAKDGKFEIADGGTLLIDEIGEMPPSLQAKLLHVLEESTFTRAGGSASIHVDTRIVSTASRPLEAMIAAGDFRKDLYFRLQGMRLVLPPLRDRTADIPLLCERFVREYALGESQCPTRIPERLMSAFLSYHWPGNVRELKHLVQRYLILPDVDLVLSELGGGDGVSPSPPLGTGKPAPRESAAIDSGTISLKSIAAKAAEAAEKQVILQVLRETRWNRRRAAARLDICYKTLLNKLHHWNLFDEAMEVGSPALSTLPRSGATPVAKDSELRVQV